VGFEEELNRVLPADLPHREAVIRKSAAHLDLIVEANRYFNLTRITDPRESAIKHVLDSVVPWQLFAGARQVLDAGSGAGFPGIPLAVVLPETRFTLSESIGKKARFLESVWGKLDLPNVTITAERAEAVTRDGAIDFVTARALAPISRVLDLFAPALKRGMRMMLYKGPDTGQEIAAAERAARKLNVSVRVVLEYDLPDSLGSRAIVEIAR
jgi:16S rRNA (guanine527-N7)-methyltransferase